MIHEYKEPHTYLGLLHALYIIQHTGPCDIMSTAWVSTEVLCGH